MAKKEERSVADLVDEMAGIIETCDLNGEELRAYLAAFITDCGVGSAAARRKAHERLEAVLEPSR